MCFLTAGVQGSAKVSRSIEALVDNYAVVYPPKAAMKRGGWTPPPTCYVKLNVDVSFDYAGQLIHSIALE